MDKQQAKMFVSSLSSSSAKILVAFIMARTALDVQELRDWTGMKRETIYDGLRVLNDRGMVEKQALAHGRVVWLPAADVFPGFFQMSEKRTPEIPVSSQMSVLGTSEVVQESGKRTSGSRSPENGHLTLVGGGESINLIDLDSSINPKEQVSEIRTSGFPSAKEILAQTPLLFDGSVVISKGLDDREPLDVLAWCAYAYSQKRNIRGAGGVVRNRLMDNERPPQWAKNEWAEVLPESFLEVLNLIDYSCGHCDQRFEKRALLDEHVRASHHICIECGQAFDTEDIEREHYAAKHHPDRKPAASEPIAVPVLDGSIESTWQVVLALLQEEMPRAAFDTWVRDTKVIRYDGNAIEIGTRNAYARDWLASRLTDTISQLLVGGLNKEIDVRFVISTAEEES